MSPNLRDKLRRDASIAKMRAMRLRGTGDANDEWQAIVLLHAAARDETAALATLESPSLQEKTGAHVEACGLLVEAKDPVGAAQEWARLPSWAFTSEAGAALLSQVGPMYEGMLDSFFPMWRSIETAPGSVPTPTAVPYERMREACDAYPGVAAFWWALSLNATGDEAKFARDRMLALAPALDDADAARAAWKRIGQTLVRKLKIEMKAERAGGTLGLDLVSRIATAFGDLLTSFVEKISGNHVALVPTSAVSGSFIFDIAAEGLPPRALEELSDALSAAPERIDAGRLVQLLTLLQQNGVMLTISSAAGHARTPGIVIDAKRREMLLEPAQARALSTLDSNDVPQADRLDRVFAIVERMAANEIVNAETLEITPRQVSYYRRATKILGLVSENDALTPVGRLTVRLGSEARMRATVVLLESSQCGDAWIRWSKGTTLLDVDPTQVHDFLRECVPGLSLSTANRRAKTLVAWYHELIDYHYAR
jgi:hypothetical protein